MATTVKSARAAANKNPNNAGGGAGNVARRALARIKAGAGRLAGGARNVLSRFASPGGSKGILARSKGVTQRFGANGPSAGQRAKIEARGLASPIGGRGKE